MSSSLLTSSHAGHQTSVRRLLHVVDHPLLPLAYEAVCHGHVEVVKEYLRRGVSANSEYAACSSQYTHVCSEYQRQRLSLLVHACLHAQPQVVQLLLQHGAKANPARGMLPLKVALNVGTKRGHDESLYVKIYQFNKNSLYDRIVNNVGNRLPLEWNRKELDHRRGQMVEVLLAFGAKLTKRFAIDSHEVLLEASRKGWLDVVGSLASNGQGDFVTEALCEASYMNQKEVVQYLIGIGVPVDGVSHGRTPLMYASLKGSLQCVRELLSHGADPNWKNGSGCTPLHFASQNGKYAIVPVLVGGGARVDEQTGAGETALHLACACESEMLGAMVVLSLLAAGADVGKKDRGGMLPLHVASQRGRCSILAELLKKCEDLIDVETLMGETALHLACATRDPAMAARAVAALLKAGADPNVPDDTGRMPLMLACELNRKNVVRVFMQSH